MKDLIFSSWRNQVVDNRGKELDAFEPADNVALPEYFKQDQTLKALIGWYGIILRSPDVNVVDLCRSYMLAVHQQSCGKCIPCRTGTGVMHRIIQGICQGKGQDSDIEMLQTLARTVAGTAKCSIGQFGPAPILHALDHFAEAFAEAIRKGAPVAAGSYQSKVTAPCMDACPIHLDIPKYVECIKEAKFQESLDVIRQKLPVPGIVGRVCVCPCEEHCRRENLDEAISIKYLKRFVADQELALN